MNIFILSTDPVEAAQMQCDKHVCKMVLESTQMLLLGVPEHISPYKHAYQHHPCSKWTLATVGNYEWHLQHALALSEEYTHRYKRTHKCDEYIKLALGYHRVHGVVGNGILTMTPFAQAMPDQYKDSNTVTAYRAYYKGDKTRFAKWKRERDAPYWW
jgi:hypothetical protein